MTNGWSYEALDFLLDREPRSSMVTTFDLRVASTDFPEFDAEMRRRLARTPAAAVSRWSCLRGMVRCTPTPSG